MGTREDDASGEPQGRGVSWSEPVSWDPAVAPGQRGPEPDPQYPPQTDRAPLGASRRRGSFVVAVVVVVLLSAAAVVAISSVLRQRGVEGSPAAAAPPSTGTTAAPAPATTTSAAAGACVNRVDGQIVHGDGPGGTANGPDAILGFQHAYYVERSGARVRDYAAAAGEVPDAEMIQSGIDSVPLGATHCLAITPQGPDRYGVELTETRPDGTVTVYKQVVTTAVEDGKTLVAGIAQAAE